ncbi:MAG: hypothetical protein V2I76_00985 [Roseobacter sp.]|nr:hypothetical protein [Roseobacter sp.]
MTDTFASTSTSLQSPATRGYAVTPDDNADIVFFSRALNVSTSGTVRLTPMDDDTPVTVFIGAGMTFPIRARRIWATGTTATDIVVLY